MAEKLLLSDGSEFKVDGKNVYGYVYTGTVKQVDVERRRMTMVGTDESKDRDGDIIRMKGWHLENYRKNPVFLWAHNYSSVPIGRTEKLVKRQNPIRMEHHLIYPTKGLHPFADMILQLYGERFINASSVGFIPNKWNDLEKDVERQPGVRSVWGREYIDQELLELSGCAVPSNPNALQDALKGKAFKDKEFKGISFEMAQKWILGQAPPPKPKNADDIMEELMGKQVEVADETEPKVHQVPESFLCAVEEEGEEPSIPEEEFTEGEKIELADVEKPYANEHACRLADPKQFDSFARKNCNAKHDGKCIDFIFGIKAGKSTLQAMRYPKASWTAGAAKSHCSGHNGSFEAAKEQDADEITIVSIYDKLTEMDTKILAFMAEMKVMIVQALKVPEESIITYTGTDLANPPSDQGSDGEGKGKKGAGEAILDEAFSKGKPQIVEPATPAPVQNFTGVITALKELRKSIDPKKED